MAYDIIHKNSTVSGTPPTTGEIEVGEIAINAADAELFVKDTAGNIRKFQNTTTGTADGVQFTQAGTGGVQRTVESKLQDVVSVKDFGAVGDGVTDDTAAIQAAINAASVTELPVGDYKVSTTINLGNGKTLQGSGKLVAAASLTGGVVGFWASNAKLKGITIDCAAVPSNVACRGITIINSGLSNLIVDSVTVESASFTGIDIFRPSGSASHVNVQIKNCTVLNSGWEGISVTGGDGILIDNCRVISSGYNGINLWKSGTSNAVITSNYVNRAVPPSRGVFNSQAESGGLLYLGPGAGNVVISNNVLIDNRNAGDDGIILGEDGTVDFNSVVISGNVVEYAGQFGIDAHSNFTVTGNTVKEARNVGIFIGADLGGTVKNITVTGNNILNTGTATHAGIGINITSNQGNLNDFKHIQITGNLVVDDRTPQYTSAGLGINLQDALFENVVVKGNNFKKCATPIAYYNTGYAGEIFVGDNQVDVPEALTGTTSTYSARGANYFTLDPGAIHTVTDFTDGYQGQEITIVFLRGDTTLDLSGSLMKAGTLTSYTPQAFSVHKATKIGSTWYWQV